MDKGGEEEGRSSHSHSSDLRRVLPSSSVSLLELESVRRNFFRNFADISTIAGVGCVGEGSLPPGRLDDGGGGGWILGGAETLSLIRGVGGEFLINVPGLSYSELGGARTLIAYGFVKPSGSFCI